MHTRLALGAALAAAALAVTACSYTGNGPLLTKDDLTGEQSTQARDLDGFTAVSIGGYADLTVTEGDEFAVTVTTDSGLQEHVTTRVDGQTLVISLDFSYFGTAPAVDVAVTLPALTELDVSGSSDATVRASSPAALAIKVSGSGDVDVAADPATLSVKVSGSGTVDAHGTVTTAQLTVSGSGDIHGKDLTAATANVTVSGSGGASVRVRDSLMAKVSGSGDVAYYGDPHVTTDVSGSGDVSRRDG